jgi:hypothetical protein
MTVAFIHMHQQITTTKIIVITARYETMRACSTEYDTASYNAYAVLTTETNVVELVLRRFYLSRILLGSIAELEDTALAELRIVIEVNLRIADDHLARRGLRQRVHLKQGAIVRDEQLVQLLNNFLALLMGRCTRDETQRCSEEFLLLISDAFDDIDGLLEDELRCRLGHILN